MTLDELRATIRTMKDDAADRVRLYGRVLGVEETFLNAVVNALGEVSMDEAFAALDHAARYQVGEPPSVDAVAGKSDVL